MLAGVELLDCFDGLAEGSGAVPAECGPRGIMQRHDRASRPRQHPPPAIGHDFRIADFARVVWM
jgi:hypothetical protein